MKNEAELERSAEVEQGTIALISDTNVNPDTKTLFKIAKVFNVPTELLLTKNTIRAAKVIAALSIQEGHKARIAEYFEKEADYIRKAEAAYNSTPPVAGDSRKSDGNEGSKEKGQGDTNKKNVENIIKIKQKVKNFICFIINQVGCYYHALSMKKQLKVIMIIVVTLLISLLTYTLFLKKKTAGLEGKVIDTKSKPASNIKLVVKQVEPIKGYERFETTTNANGKFLFKGLFPSSRYIIIPINATIDEVRNAVIFNSAPEGQISILDVKVRWLLSSKIVTDTLIDIQWPASDMIPPVSGECFGNKMNWDDALSCIKHLNTSNYLDHNDWRLPETYKDTFDLKNFCLKTEHEMKLVLKFAWYWSSNGKTFCLFDCNNYDRSDVNYVWPVRDIKGG
ncbi:protein containing DUF1566 [Candidatus Magnetobacterium bavaricum]|uniref:Protein containing DUF1566 n=1 Tax=Candidatus Magnetobacterium bavaricum TaxID=29290 RepID=A0A0F3GKD2_9BACT|nr:protein containing DUF1566 [Candidatus Magnetobacterium bavaricum]